MGSPSAVRVFPGPLSGRVRVPGDKSLSHRALLLGALVGAPVSVRGIAPSGDAASMASALRLLGARIDLSPDDRGGLSGTVEGPLSEPPDVLDCGNAGTAMRLLAGVAAGIAGLTVLTGDASLRRRPMERVLRPLRSMGAEVAARNDGRPPIAVRGGQLHAIDYVSDVASAQVKSCLLLAGLRAEGTTRVRSPWPSRDHTERMLAHLGRPVETEIGPAGEETVSIVPGPLAAVPVTVSADPSAAAFWLVAAAIAGTRVEVSEVCVNAGRTGALDVLAALGADIERQDQRLVAGEPVADLALTAGALEGKALVAGADVVAALDELPVLAVAGAVSAGGLEVRDAAELRVKESDRIEALARLFAAVGLRIETFPDGFRVPGGQTVRGGGAVEADGDHRIAMTAAVAATVAREPVEISGFAAVPTSYPGFLDDLQHLGGAVEVIEEET